MYKSITLKDLRPQLPKVMDDIDKALDRYIVSKHGKPIAIMLSIDDYESLVETLNEISDKQNLRRIRKAMKEVREGKTISWEDFKKKTSHTKSS